VKQFKEKIPQYMIRHRVKSGITGWAQVNGLRGDTSIEEQVLFDNY
jgi:lipopolysaccharide/colanic/teichoic acid biosynthesis glycosyltransferase